MLTRLNECGMLNRAGNIDVRPAYVVTLHFVLRRDPLRCGWG